MGIDDGKGAISNSISFKTACNGQITECLRFARKGFALLKHSNRYLKAAIKRTRFLKALETLCDTDIHEREGNELY
jgi:hypothetical protein